MSKLKLSDFKVGDKAYIKKCGNNIRYIKDKENVEEYIIETEIVSVGRKFITTSYADSIKFKEHDLNYAGLIENTQYCVDYQLFRDKQTIYDMFEEDNLLRKIKQFFYLGGSYYELSLEQLRRINEIIKECEQ